MTMILGLKIIEAKVIKECGKERNKDIFIMHSTFLLRHICCYKKFYVNLYGNNMIIMDFEKITKEAVVQALLEIKEKWHP